MVGFCSVFQNSSFEIRKTANRDGASKWRYPSARMAKRREQREMGRLRLYPALTGTPNDFHLHSGRGRMITKQRRFLACAGAIAIALLTGTDAPAQLYLGRPIKLVLAEAAGSSNDLVARLLAPPIAALLGQPVVVENRPGGGTLIGTRSVIDAAADGHTLLVSSTSALTVASLLNVSDLLKDLSPVAGIARTSWVLVVNPAIPAKSLAELVAYARANPGKLNIGFAQGTGPQFVAEAFKAVAGIDVVGIPYAGGSQVVRDLLGGSVQLYFGSAATTLPLIEAGSLRALVSTGESRDPLLPDVPTMKELGFPRMTLNSVLGIFGPAQMPQAVVERFYHGAQDSIRSAPVSDSIVKIGYVPEVRSPLEFGRLLQEYQQIWVPMAREIGFGPK
jgi:tripartite-type tricarboxylate transporter receptor subunit TctC